MSNGGPDKPGCTGGIDADRDGNNGCGNDADREDDNNGQCGLQRQSAAGETGEAEEPSEATTTTVEGSDVTGRSEVNDDTDADDADTAPSVEDDDVQKDDDATSDDGTSGSGTESPDEPKPLPLNEAGASVGLLAVLGGIVRLFLRIG
jgi:hypothetical protein